MTLDFILIQGHSQNTMAQFICICIAQSVVVLTVRHTVATM